MQYQAISSNTNPVRTKRLAGSPKLVEKLKNLISEVYVQNRAGPEADISDQDWVNAVAILMMQLHQRSPRIFAAVSPFT